MGFLASLLKPSLNWLLGFVPTAVILSLSHGAESLTFVAACLAIIPLAGWLGHATEHLAERTGEGIGGLLNATFGNAAELIITLMALRSGLYEVVKASITGSIIGNILLVLGAALLAGGVRYKSQRFNPAGARSYSTMLTLAAIALIVPAVFHFVGGQQLGLRERDLSLEISIVLILTYAASLLFSLHTHKQLFVGEARAAGEIESASAHQVWGLPRSLTVLSIATLLIVWMSEILVHSVEAAAAAFGMSQVFIGVIVVAVIGNAAEHSTAIIVALKNRMDLSLGIAIGSSIQIALFVAPVLVFASYFIGPTPMDLVFTPLEVVAIGLSVLITGQIASDGESNWLEGTQLLAVYAILALAFYFV